MKSFKGAFALGLLPTTAIAQAVVTISLPTCVPGGGTGINTGPAPTGPTTEVIDVTATNSLGSVTIEPITQVVTPGASATPSEGARYDTAGGIYIEEYNFALPVGSSAPLDGASTSSGDMSVEYCGAYCGGSAFFALYNGNTCNCGSSATLTALPEEKTCTSCSGNTAECCGAPGEATLYSLAPSSGPSTFVSKFTTTNSLGSTVVETTTAVTTAPVTSTTPNTFTTAITTTNSLGSTVVETSTGTSPGTSTVEPSTSVGPTTPIVSTTPGVPTTPVGSTTPVGPTTTVPPDTTMAPIGPSSTTATTPTGSDLCPLPPNTPYTDSNGRTYIVQCTGDYPGNDLQSSRVTSLVACMEYCDTLTGCIGVSFGAPDSCYPKSNITGIDYNYGNFDSAYVNTYDEDPQTVTTFPTNPVDGSTVAVPPATTPTTGAPPPPATTPTTAAPPPPETTPATTPVVAPTTTPVPSTTATGSGPIQTVGGTPACPANNNSYYETVFDNTYVINCGLDLVGTNGDEVFHADTYVDCLESCDLLVGCVAVTYTGTGSPTTLNCYPYYTVTGTTSAGTGSELFAGQNVNGPNTGDDTPDAYCDPTSPTDVNQTVINDYFGNNYKIGCGQQIDSPDALVSVDTTNLEACIYYCSISESCVAVTYTGTHTEGVHNSANCYTFSSNGTVQYQGNVDYAVRQA